jgi:hypothetical protein
MRLPDDNISATHPNVLYSQLIRQHDSLLAWRLEITGHCLYPDDFVRHDNALGTRGAHTSRKPHQIGSALIKLPLSGILPSARRRRSNSDSGLEA